MNFWRKYLIVGVGFGCGAVITTALITGAVTWFNHRPKSWNTSAVTASFDQLEEWDTLENDGKTPSKLYLIKYVLRNTTSRDYTLATKGNVEFMCGTPTKLRPQSAFELPDRIFIPAGHATEVSMVAPSWFRKEEQESFVLFDKLNYYEIQFPIVKSK